MASAVLQWDYALPREADYPLTKDPLAWDVFGETDSFATGYLRSPFEARVAVLVGFYGRLPQAPESNGYQCQQPIGTTLQNMEWTILHSSRTVDRNSWMSMRDSTMLDAIIEATNPARPDAQCLCDRRITKQPSSEQELNRMPKNLASENGQFKKGKSGNPGGRPSLPKDLRNAKKLNRIEFERIANKFSFRHS